MVKAYRNLKHGRKARPLYSILSRGRVIRRTRAVMLRDCTFTISRAGLARCRQEGVKNVHAYVHGTLAHSGMGTDRHGELPVRVSYSPARGQFYDVETGKELNGAMCVILNGHGMTASYVR